ncbi:MAG: type II toxin-antitoxin system VapC family toxin [Chthoniobacterales bacterium]|nr:type II toxin-antitoxin system VapC family toxin [Chthoniobacterales bacterium]
MIVVDTNIICLRWIPAKETALAEALLRRDPEWSSALLWRWEFRNAMVGYIRRRSLTAATAVELYGRAETSLAQHEYVAPAQDVFELVTQSACTAYDCEFVAIARERGVRLVTADQQVLREFPHIAISLGDFLDS